MACKLLIIILLRSLSSLEDEGHIHFLLLFPLLFFWLLCIFLRLLFLGLPLDFLLDSSELLGLSDPEFELELELEGEPLVLALRLGEESLPSLPIDLVLDDLDLDITGDFPLDLELDLEGLSGLAGPRQSPFFVDGGARSQPARRGARTGARAWATSLFPFPLFPFPSSFSFLVTKFCDS